VLAVIDPQSAWKADIIFVGDREFDRIEFERRRAARLFGLEVYVISPEGSILTKRRRSWPPTARRST
jgi:hypothetical protein